MTHERPARAGFALVELVMVVLIVGLVAALVMPNVQRVLLRARATEAIGDLQVVRVAALNFAANNHRWPEDANRGIVPTGLVPYLPDGFQFASDQYTLDYDNWLGTSPGFVGLTVITPESDLGLLMTDILQPNAWTNGSNKFTWVIEWGE